MTDFEREVLARLAELKAQMRTLVGNGQPGRIQELEARVGQHEKFLQRVSGLLVLFVPALTLIQLVLYFLRGR